MLYTGQRQNEVNWFKKVQNKCSIVDSHEVKKNIKL